VETLHLVGQAGVLHEPLRNPERFRVEHQGRADDDTGGNRNAAFDFH
jgi:hypothetical protein